jgi:uncharacterized protein with PQ loop repeat
MDLESFILFLNIIISILHPIKHLPQIAHTIQTKKVEDLSKINILCELGLNILSVTSYIMIYICMEKKTLFIPIIVEKVSSLIFIGTIYYLKIKYTTSSYTYEEIRPVTQNNVQIENYKSINL